MLSLRLAGTAQSQVTVPKIRIDGVPSLETFLMSDASDELLLGTQEFRQVDGVWECRQQPVEWFSVSIVPVFREVIERPLSPPSASVKDGVAIPHPFALCGTLSLLRFRVAFQ